MAMRTFTTDELGSYFNARANYKSAEESWNRAKKDLFALAEYFVGKMWLRCGSIQIDNIKDLHNGFIEVDFIQFEDGGGISSIYIPVFFLTGDWESVDESIQAFKDYTKKKRQELEKEHRKVCETAKKQRFAEQEEDEKKEYVRLKKKFEVVNGRVVGRKK